jgi:hypothetical protein
MASVGLTEAARLVGRNQSTVHRAMQTGRLSYTTDSAGKRVVDTAELDRVFGIENLPSIDGMNGASLDGHAHAAKSQSAHVGDMHIARGEHAALHQLLADREACIADLRGRLDASEAERRQLSERLHGMLTARTDQREGTDPLVAAKMGNPILPAPSASSGLAIPRPPWWRRWFR